MDGSRVIPKTKWKKGNSKSISRIQIDPSVTSRSDTTKKRIRDHSSRGNTSNFISERNRAMNINNILEMRYDYNDIYIRCSECRDLPTVDERRKEAGRICKDFNIVFERYAVVDLIGKEFLKRA